MILLLFSLVFLGVSLHPIMSNDRYVSPAKTDTHHVSYFCCSDIWDDIFSESLPLSADSPPLPVKPGTNSDINDTHTSLNHPAPVVRRTSFQSRKQQYLDEDVIRRDLLNWTCESKRCGDCLSALTRNECMSSFAVSHIHGLRQRTFDHKEQEIKGYIERTLASLLRKSASTLQYVVCGVETCKSAFNWAHGFADSTSNRAHAKFNEFWRKANPKTDLKEQIETNKTGLPTQVAERWILEWIMLASHNPPNSKKHQPSVPKLGASVLYPQYARWCTGASEYPIQRDGFRGKLSTIKRMLDVATRSSKQGSKECPVCSVLKRASAEATGLYLKREIQLLYARHIEFTNCEVDHYLRNSFAAKDNPQVRVM